jgi:hypothetical protein
MVKRRYSSTILNLGPRHRWVFSFTKLPLYTRGEPPVSIVRRLGGPQIRSGRYRKEKKSLPPVVKPRILGRPARSLVAVPTELSIGSTSTEREKSKENKPTKDMRTKTEEGETDGRHEGDKNKRTIVT